MPEITDGARKGNRRLGSRRRIRAITPFCPGRQAARLKPMLLRLAQAVIAANLLLLAPAGAQEAASPAMPQAGHLPVAMTFTIVEGGPDSCGPGCSRWIAAEGVVLPGTVVAFRDFVRALGETRPPVAVHSQGGIVEVTMALGRLVRQAKLDTIVARTDRSGPSPILAMDGDCHGACFYLLAAGVNRSAAPGAAISIAPVDFKHQAGGELPDALRARLIAATLEKVRAYLGEMGLDPTLSVYLDGDRYEPFYPARGMLDTYGLVTKDPGF